MWEWPVPFIASFLQGKAVVHGNVHLKDATGQPWTVMCAVSSISKTVAVQKSRDSLTDSQLAALSSYSQSVFGSACVCVCARGHSPADWSLQNPRHICLKPENGTKSETFLQKTPWPWKHFWLKRFKFHSVLVLWLVGGWSRVAVFWLHRVSICSRDKTTMCHDRWTVSDKCGPERLPADGVNKALKSLTQKQLQEAPVTT